MRLCDKCRKQVPERDYERHVEKCQKVLIHTTQNAQGPKIIDFTTIESGKGPLHPGRGGANKQRIASAKPPQKVAVNSEEFGQIREQNIPKWKLQSEAIRRAVGGQLV